MSGLSLSGAPDRSGDAGVWGKIPSRGDFLTGRGPAIVVRPLEAWLDEALALARRRHGEGFSAVWSAAPIWRFSVRGGVFGPRPVAGTICPSVDSGGREYPLVLFSILGAGAEPLMVLADGGRWFAALEALSLEALSGARGPGDLADAVAALGPPPVRGRTSGDLPPATIEVSEAGVPMLDDPPPSAAAAWVTVGGPGAAAWGRTDAEPPSPAVFAALLVPPPVGEPAR